MKYNSHPIDKKPEILFGFDSKSENELLEKIKLGKLSENAQKALIYVFRNKFRYTENQLDKIDNDFINEREKQIFESFGIFIETKPILTIKMTQSNHVLMKSILILLIHKKVPIQCTP